MRWLDLGKRLMSSVLRRYTRGQHLLPLRQPLFHISREAPYTSHPHASVRGISYPLYTSKSGLD